MNVHQVCAYCLSATLLCASAQAANKTWTSAANGDFGAAGSWTGGVPGTADTATFNVAGTYTVTFDNTPNPLVNPVLNQDLFFQAGAASFISGSGGPYTYRLTGLGGDDAIITGGSLGLGVSGSPLHMVVDDDLRIRGGATLSANFGSHVTTADLFLGDSISPTGAGTIILDGAGSLLTVSGSAQFGTGGEQGTLTVRNGAAADFNGTLGLADASTAHFSNGVVNVQSGASITAANIRVSTNATNGQSGTFNVGNAVGVSTVTQDAGATLIVGAALGGPTPNAGALNANAGGVFNSGASPGAITINRTGSVNIAGGALNANGDVTIDGGVLQRGANGAFTMAAGKTMTIQNGGRFTVTTAGYTTATNAIYNVTGANAKLETLVGSLNLNNGAEMNITSGGYLYSNNGMDIGTTGNGTLLVDGIGSSVLAASQFWGALGNTATVTIRNGATANFVFGPSLAFGTDAGTKAIVNVQSGAHVDVGILGLAELGGTTTSATLIITGSGSSVTLNPSELQALPFLTVGHAETGQALIQVTDNGALTVGAGGSTILKATGVISISGGGTVDLQRLDYQGGAIHFSSGALSFIGNLTVGDGGLLGTSLTLAGNRQLTVNGTTTVDPGRTLTVNGGALNANAIVVNGTLIFQSGVLGAASGIAVHIDGAGVLQAGGSINQPIDADNVTINITANGISLGSAASFSGFRHQGVLNVGGNAITLQSAGYARLGVLTLLVSGTINAPNGVTFAAGSNLQAHGTVNARVTRELGSVIEADGALSLGDSTSPAGFNFAGELRANQHAVTLTSSAQASLGNLTTLGSGANPGTLNAMNGLIVDFGEAVTGFGVVNSTDSLAKRTIINGVAQGTSPTQPLTFSGYVKGVGSFDNVNFTGTFDPGLSPTLLTVGNISLASASRLIIEIGGTDRGGDYDAILASGNLALGGALQVSLINGFPPTAGDRFDIFDYGSLSGAFSFLQLPNLGNGLQWDASELYTLGALAIVPRIMADFQEDGDVDAADLELWRTGFGTGNSATHTQGDADGDHDVDGVDFLLWQRQLGSGGPAIAATTPVPEPGALALFALAACSLALVGQRHR